MRPVADNSMTLSIRPYEIVPATRAITVTTAEPLEPSAMRRAARGGWPRYNRRLPDLIGTMPAGRQTLVIDEFRGANGRLSPGGHAPLHRRSTHQRIPVRTWRSRASSACKLTDDGVRRLWTTTVVDVVKGEEHARRPAMAVGKQVDLDKHLAAIAKRQSERLGRHPP